MTDAQEPATSSPSLRTELLLYLAVIAAVAIVFANVLIHPTETIYSPYSDILGQHHPFRHLMAEGLQTKGRLPLWNPTTFGGMPLVGDPQAGLFYPLNWPHAIGDPDKSSLYFGHLMALHLVIGGWGTLWWLRGHGFAPLARLVGALAFMFCGKWFYHVVVPGHVIFLPLVWLPWQCGLIDRIWWRPSPRYCALLALVSSMAILGDHPQLLFYSQLLAAGYAIVIGLTQPGPSRAQSIGWFVLAGLLAFAVGAVQLLPALDLIEQNVAIRGSGVDYKYASSRSLHFSQYISFLIPSTIEGGWEFASYVGVLSAVLSLFGWLRRQGRGVALYFLGVIVFSLWFGMGEHGGLHRFFHDHVPGFHLFRIASRLFLILGLPVAYLAAAGFASLCMEPIDWIKRSLSLLLLMAAAAVVWFYPTLDGGLAAIALLIPALSQLPAPPTLRPVFTGAVVVLLFLDQARYAMPMVVTLPLREAIGENPIVDLIKAPLGQGRVLALNAEERGDFTSLPITYTSPAGLEDLRGFNPLVPRSTFRYLWSGAGQQPLEFRPSTGIRNFPIAERKYLDLFNVRWIVSNQPLNIDGLVLRETFDDVKVYHFSMKTHELSTMPKTYVYENTRVFPRAALIRRARLADSLEEAIADIKTLDPRQEVLVEDESLVGRFDGDFLPLNVEHQGDEIFVTVDTGAGGYLFVSEMWYPGWKAFDNGSPIEIHRGNGVFQVLKLGPGKHEIHLQYLPDAYILARWLTGVGVGLCGLMLLLPASLGRSRTPLSTASQ